MKTEVRRLSALVVCFSTLGTNVCQLGQVPDRPGLTLEEALERARKAGLILRAVDMQKLVPPPSQNAAPFYVDLAAIHTPKVRIAQFGDKDLPWHSANFIAEKSDVPALTAYLNKHQRELSLIYQAAKRPQCVFRRAWNREDPSQIMFPEFAAMRHGVRLLYAQSQLLSLQGRFTEAIEAMRTGLVVARHAGNEPTIISMLIRLALESISLSGLRKIMYFSNGKPDVAASIRQAVEACWKPTDYSDALRGEAFMGYRMLEVGKKLGPSAWAQYTEDDGKHAGKVKPGKMSVGERTAWHAMISNNQAIILDRIMQAVAASKAPFSESRPKLKSIFQESRRSEEFDQWQGYADILSLDYSTPAEKCANISAHASVTRLAAAILEWREQNGKWPDNLGTAIQPTPSDPFDGKPLRYRLEDRGFVVYSVGPTGKYDGGSPLIKPKSSDAVFRYPRPSYVRPAREYKPTGK